MNGMTAQHPPVNMKQLSYFVTLAEYGSISSAAKALNMAQPSLSENLAKLEKHFEATLVIRSPRGVQFTEAGMMLAQRGRELLGIMGNLAGEVRGLSGEPRGPVSVGLPLSLSSLVSVPLVETASLEFPKIRLHVAEAMSSKLMNWLDEDRIDFAYIYEAADTARYMRVPFLKEELFLATAPDNWIGEIGEDGFALEPLDAEKLEQLPLITNGRTKAGWNAQINVAQALGLSLNIVNEIDSLTCIIEMVARASGYSLLSHGAACQEVAEGRLVLVPIRGLSLKRTAYVVRPRYRPVSRASTAIEATIREVIRDMVKRYNLRATVIEGHADQQHLQAAA